MSQIKKISMLLTLSLLYCNLASGITLTDSRLYVLNENISETVTIEVDNVTLDLNGYTISPSEGWDAIEVAEDLCNITIKNGNIVGPTDQSGDPLLENGIFATEGCSFIRIENVNIKNVDNGINFEGAGGYYQSATIRACNVKNCLIENCTQGVNAEYVTESTFENVEVSNFTDNAFNLEYNVNNCFYCCKAHSTTTAKANGFVLNGGSNCVLDSCVVQNLLPTSFQTSGIKCTNCNQSTIVNCIISSIRSFGIELEESSDCLIKNNNIKNITTDSGIIVSFANSNTIYNNIVNQASLGGFSISESSENNIIDSNEASNCSVGFIDLDNNTTNKYIRNAAINNSTGYNPQIVLNADTFDLSSGATTNDISWYNVYR